MTPQTGRRTAIPKTCNCRACGFDKWALNGPGFTVFVCRRCDTSAQSGSMRVGPPKSPGTRDGWFHAPFGDTK